MIRRFAGIALVAGLAAVGVAQAQNLQPIEARKQLMKGVGQATGAAARMVRGEAPFSADTAAASMRSYGEAAARMAALFPADSKMGGDTEALPAIWDKRAEFEAAVAKFGADVAANAGKTASLDEFRLAFQAVTRNCGGCHEQFRVKK